MNLTTGKWVPVVWNDGRPDKVSLLDIFQKGDTIRDLAVRPHERIALMRLFICIAQASLDGPRNRIEWLKCRERLPKVATDYLGKWKHAFELFGDGQRFLQVPNVTPVETGDDNDPPLVSKLDLALATGSASTLFDNAGGSPRRFSVDDEALMLLTFQCFSPGGLLSECLWSGAKTKKAGNVAAPCLAGKMVQTYLLDRTSLLRSVWFNLLSKDQLLGKQVWGKATWEAMPAGPSDATNIENASRTYLGRLVPVSRAVRLSDDGVSMTWGCAIDYPNFDSSGWRDPTGTVFVTKDAKGEPTRRQLGGSLDRSLWRELAVISVLDHADDNQLGGPFALHNAAEFSGIDIFCGAVVHAKGKTTTILNTVEAVLHLPAPMFADKGQRLYQQGVRQAESWGRRVGYAISVCHRELHDELDRAEFRKRGNLVKYKAASHYWTAIEQDVPLLLDIVRNPDLLFPEGATKEMWGNTAWGRVLAKAAREAYELACPRGTPRQLRAYSLGLSALFNPGKAETTKSDSEENEE